MLNVCRYINSIIKSVRYLSINKSYLVQSSRNIQIVLKSFDDKCSILKWFYSSLNEIHKEYPSMKIATSTKQIYQLNSSKLNSVFIQFENDRKKQVEDFEKENPNEFLVLLRYIRFLQVAFIYRVITFDINNALKETSHSIINLSKHQNNFDKNSLSLICELTFFVNYLCCHHSLSDVKSLLSDTFIPNCLSNYLFSILSEDPSILIVNQLCLTLHSIIQIPSLSSIDLWPCELLKYLHSKKSNSLSIIKYLILIQHNCINQCSSEMISILNEYLIQTGIHQLNLNIICHLLILISSCNYSHQLFNQDMIQKIEKCLKISRNDLSDVKLCCRLIYYLCLNDPTNRFNSRSTIVELSKQINENLSKEIHFPQWIVQAQHGMMLSNIYNYQLLFSTLDQNFFPKLFGDLGIYSLTIYRQLFDIHYALSIDRPSLKTPLLNSEMLSFATKICDKYRSSVRSSQRSYNRLLNELKQLFNQIYGKDSCQIINTNKDYPYILFDFLELNFPDRDELKAIGINTKQRVAILPILNSMLIKQQREDGSLVRILSAHTTMRYRLIQKTNYQVIPIFHGEYLRAIRDNTFKSMFETNLALKNIPHQTDNHQPFQF